MACLQYFFLPLTLVFPPLSNIFSFGIGGGGAYIGRDGACEG
jgi:hypothetical protein